ncbi:MAG: HD domain-containing protein [Methanothrix sp.]|nr:MAG: HD domain-containing protein [Methanothrix sp.]
MASHKFDPESWLNEIRPMYQVADPAHDFSHILRVYKNARIIGQEEGADMQVLLLAALLHDVGSEKKHTSKQGESEGQGKRAVEAFLESIGLEEEAREKVHYAVDVHRFSKGIVPVTLEARILQDADRLDALGAIGIARVFLTGGTLGRELYHPDDPFCRSREPDDGKWNLDHFYRKLLKLELGMHTESAKKLAAARTAVLRRYLQDLEEEIGTNYENGYENNKRT